MKLATIVTLALLAGGGEHERGLALMQQGQYTEAAAAFRAAAEEDGPSAELSYNLSLALWRAGMFDEAETAAEEAATLSDGAFSGLRDGVLGNLRYTQAQAVRAEDLEVALGLANQARDHYLRGATRGDARPELARNLERAQALVEELEKEIEEQEKEEQEQEDQENQDNEDQENDEDQQKKDQDQQDQEQKDQQDEENKDQEQSDEQQDQQQEGEGEQPPEPQPEEEQEQPQPDDEQQQEEEQQPQEQDQEQQAPGEQLEGRELAPEEKKRLMDKLEEMQQALAELRARQKAKRAKVEKDW